ncbi:MAG: sporulation initiation inhibitor Soj [Clostridiales bacterium]|nr:MAG: sporulation initiation inhibitor Soj [Clostridiales bacterium]PWL49322.1 MAG: sporulation initiation inhibitor Soj [Clostridiales bacterium]
MGRIIVVANQKGGVGKTTTAVNLAACMAQLDRKTLLIDADPQGNATSGIGVDKRKLESSIYDVLINHEPVRQAILHSAVQNLDVLPSNIDLAGAEIEMVSMISRETILARAVQEIREEYDYIFIDAPPSLGLITLNAFAAADQVLIPIQCEFYALEGLSQLIKTISLIKKHINKTLEVEGVVLTMYDGRTNLSIQVVEEVKRFFAQKVHRSVIPRNVRLGEAPSHGKPITVYDPKCAGAEAYMDLARELMETEDENG